MKPDNILLNTNSTNLKEVQLDGQPVRPDLCGQDVFIERLWRSLKYEEVYLKAYETVVEARSGIGAWMTFYNHERTHQSLERLTPENVYFNKPTEELAA